MPFSAENAGKEEYFLQERFKGLCFLNEHAVPTYTAACPNCVYGFLPDISYASLALRKPPLVEEIHQLAAGRTVMLLCDSIENRKNISAFCKFALMADSTRWFFAVVGQTHVQTFSEQEKQLMASFVAAPKRNPYFCDAFFDEEGEINALIQSADILFATYKNFQNSGNMLGKATYFEKPILVSDGYLMAYRIRRYAIGVVVPQDDVHAMLSALERLAAEPLPPENFGAYRQLSMNELRAIVWRNFLIIQWSHNIRMN
jgi:hypothetical protein